MLSNGKSVPISDIKIGNMVKAIDSKGKLIDTEVIEILHRDSNSSSN